MRNVFLILSIIFFTGSTTSAQCIDEDKIKYGGDFGSYDYTFFCPTYSFSYKGETSKKWSILNPIDIRQVEPTILPVKKTVEQKIKEYAGEAFFSRLTFYTVDIVYPDSIDKFKGRMPEAKKAGCKGKYYFYYYFRADAKAAYCVGFAVDEKMNIISPFNFPSKQDYKPIDTTLTVCKVIKKAKRFGKKLSPIDKIEFEYDSKAKRFYWLVTQEIVVPKAGLNTRNQLVVDAAEPTKVAIRKEQVHVSF
ncbi:hypothetical protein GCM10027594_15760 [Hymenobacter agri]